LSESEEDDQSFPPISVSFLTIADAYALVKLFFQYSFYSSLFFGIPYLLFYSIGIGVEAVSVSTGNPILLKMFGWIVYGLVVVLLLKHMPEILHAIGKWLTDLAAVMSKLSTLKQFLLTAWAVGWIYLGSRYPKVSFWLVVTVFIPAGLIYDKYVLIALERAVARHRENTADNLDSRLEQATQPFQTVILPPVGFTPTSASHNIKTVIWVLAIVLLILFSLSLW
jgi:hypothetical protein